MEQMDMFGGSTMEAQEPEEVVLEDAVQLGLAVEVPVLVKLGRVKVSQASVLA